MKQLRIHYLQHVDFEDLGFIKTWATKNNHTLSSTKFYNDATLPNIDDFDWLIIMGGPMNIHDENTHSWLKTEKEFIKKSIEAEKTVLGICLGCQLIASILGSNIYPNSKKEIGWLPLRKTIEGQNHQLLSNLPTEFISFHWHGDTFDLPKEATHLFETTVCSNQGFIYNEKVVGLQFHLETTENSLLAIVDNCRGELIPDTFIQSENEIIEKADFCKKTNQYLVHLLNNLAQ